MSNTTLKARERLHGINKKLGLNKKCPQGQILRAPYTRKYTNAVKKSGFIVKRGNKTVRIYPKGSSVIVPASCIDDKLNPDNKGMRIGPLKEGDLTKYGYNVRIGRTERHRALKKAIIVYGALTVYHKLDAVMKLTIRTAPDAHKVFKADIEWLRKNYTLKKK
jgi:hypothetical protein